MTPRAHERLQARLWIKSYLAVVAHPTLDVSRAEVIADQAVSAFKARFHAGEPDVDATRVGPVSNA